MGPLILSVLLYHCNKQYINISNAVFGHYFDPKLDIILITGGCNGLGKELARQFAETGAKTIVADIFIPTEEDKIPHVSYYHCDVSKPEDIISTSTLIEEQIGVVSILVNNAGIVHGKPVLDLNFTEIEDTIKINLLASFYTIKVFLPGMIKQKRGYIVTIASILGYMSPARLGDYGASKSGLIALHESLTYELGPPSLTQNGLKTLLVCPGQLKTRMFGSISTPNKLFAPELEPNYVAKKVIKALAMGRRGEIRLPMYGNFLPILRSFPWPIVEALRNFSGMDTSMMAFKSVIGVVNSISEQVSLNESEHIIN